MASESYRRSTPRSYKSASGEDDALDMLKSGGEDARDMLTRMDGRSEHSSMCIFVKRGADFHVSCERAAVQLYCNGKLGATMKPVPANSYYRFACQTEVFPQALGANVAYGCRHRTRRRSAVRGSTERRGDRGGSPTPHITHVVLVPLYGRTWWLTHPRTEGSVTRALIYLTFSLTASVYTLTPRKPLKLGRRRTVPLTP